MSLKTSSAQVIKVVPPVVVPSEVNVQAKDGKSAPIRLEIPVQSVAPAPNKSSESISKDSFAGKIQY